MEKLSLTEYLCQVEQWMTDCPKWTRAQLVRGLRQEIAEFTQQMPDCTVEDIVELFGEPQDVARQLMEAVPPKERKAMQFWKRYGMAIVIAILCAIIFEMGILFWEANRNPKNRIREIVYTSQPYFSRDSLLERGI